MCSHLEVDGKRPKGRPRKTWLETIQSDMRGVGLKAQDALDRVRWRAGISSGRGGELIG